MSRSIMIAAAVLTLTAGSVLAASPATGGASSQQVPTSSAPSDVSAGSWGMATMPADNGRCPRLYDQGNTVFGGPGCAGGGGGSPRDHAGRLE